MGLYSNANILFIFSMDADRLRHMMDDARCHVKTAIDLIAARGSLSGVAEVLQLVNAEVIIMPSLLGNADDRQGYSTDEVTRVTD